MNIQTDIVDKVTSLIVATCKPVYKHVKPAGVAGVNFSVVNCLPVIPGHFDQAIANVNVHVKDLDASKQIPDDVTLKSRSEAVLTAVNNYSDSTYDVSFQQSALMFDSDSQTHYINLRFLVTIINQN